MSFELRTRDGFIRVATQLNTMLSDVGQNTSLSTTAKDSIVSAINEVKSIADAAAASGGVVVNDVATNSSDAWSSQKITDFVSAQFTALVDGAPGALDTLNEIATALQGNDGDISSIMTSLANRVRTDTAAQGLTGTQKTNARTNIDAVSTTAVGDTDRDFAADFTGALT